MARQVFKLRSKRLGEHIHTTVFSGEENCTLVWKIEEWQLFSAVFFAGAITPHLRNHIMIEEVVENG